MDWIKAALFTGLLSTFIPYQTADLSAAEWNQGRHGCRRSEPLNIQDLDMAPDPVSVGQRVRAWKVRIKFDGRRDCQTDVLIREGNNIVGHARDYRMRPGINEIEIPAVETFRYTGREHCFNVQVDLDGSRQQIDAARRFCARQRNVWTMREPGDPGRVSLR